jgi:hypothetical protein
MAPSRVSASAGAGRGVPELAGRRSHHEFRHVPDHFRVKLERCCGALAADVLADQPTQRIGQGFCCFTKRKLCRLARIQGDGRGRCGLLNHGRSKGTRNLDVDPSHVVLSVPRNTG